MLKAWDEAVSKVSAGFGSVFFRSAVLTEHLAVKISLCLFPLCPLRTSDFFYWAHVPLSQSHCCLPPPHFWAEGSSLRICSLFQRTWDILNLILLGALPRKCPWDCCRRMSLKNMLLGRQQLLSVVFCFFWVFFIADSNISYNFRSVWLYKLVVAFYLNKKEMVS